MLATEILVEASAVLDGPEGIGAWWPLRRLHATGSSSRGKTRFCVNGQSRARLSTRDPQSLGVPWGPASAGPHGARGPINTRHLDPGLLGAPAVIGGPGPRGSRKPAPQ